MLIVLARIIWQMYPNVWCCLGFWSVVLWSNRPAKTQPHTLLLFAGAAFNAVATIGNGGKMPVVGRHGSPVSVWRAARPGDHFLLLCDRINGFSIGDMLIGVWFIFVIGIWVRDFRTSRQLSSRKTALSDVRNLTIRGQTKRTPILEPLASITPPCDPSPSDSQSK